MRIGFDAKRLFSNFTGLGNYSRTTLDILLKYVPDHQYLLFAPKTKETEATKRFLGKAQPEVVLPHGAIGGSLWRTFLMGKDLREHRVELFHGLSNELPSGLRKRGIRSLVTIHDVAFRTFTDMYKWHDRQIYDIKWKHACRHADKIIAISESTKRDIIRFYNIDEQKIEVVYQPVAPLFYEKQPTDGARRLAEETIPNLPQHFMLYVGSVNSRKNLLGIVKAMELLPSDLQIPLVVVGGGGSYKQEVLRYIEKQHLHHLFIFPKRIDSDVALQALYQSASLFVYPSFYEGFGLPVVEALLSGCPVVTSDVSSLPEAGGPASLKASPSSIESIADCISQVLSDNGQREKMVDEGYAYAMQIFNPEKLALQLAECYESCKTLF